MKPNTYILNNSGKNVRFNILTIDFTKKKKKKELITKKHCLEVSGRLQKKC